MGNDSDFDEPFGFDLTFSKCNLIGEGVFPSRPLTRDELIVMYENKISTLGAKVNRSLLRIIWDRFRGKV
jgi:hypothetical protein